MLDNLKKYDIVLASNSPRRRELLSRLGIDFRVFTLMGIDETFPKGLSNEEIALHIASTKAEAYKTHITDNTAHHGRHHRLPGRSCVGEAA